MPLPFNIHFSEDNALSYKPDRCLRDSSCEDTERVFFFYTVRPGPRTSGFLVGAGLRREIPNLIPTKDSANLIWHSPQETI